MKDQKADPASARVPAEAPPSKRAPAEKASGAALRYDAFLSYSHRDRRLAKKISDRLRTYRPPRPSGLSRRLRVFRDVERLTAGASLDSLLVDQIESSQHLVLLLSPDAAASEHVDREVASFLARRGTDRLRLVLLHGELADVLPEALRPLPQEPLFIDLREAGRRRFRDETLRLIASLFGVDYDRLHLQDRTRRRQRQVGLAAGVLALVLVIGSAFLVSSTPEEIWQRVPQPVTRTWSNALLPVRQIAIRRSEPRTVVWLGRNARHAAYLDSEGKRWTLQIFQAGSRVREFAERARRVAAPASLRPLARLELETSAFGPDPPATVDVRLLALHEGEDVVILVRGDVRRPDGSRVVVPTTEVDPTSWLESLEPFPAGTLREMGLAGHDLEGSWIDRTNADAEQRVFYAGDLSDEAREVLDVTASAEFLLFSNDAETEAWLEELQESEDADVLFATELEEGEDWITPTSPESSSTSFAREEIESPDEGSPNDAAGDPTASVLSALGEALPLADFYAVRTIKRADVAAAVVEPIWDSHEVIQQPTPLHLVKIGNGPWLRATLPASVERFDLVDIVRAEETPSLLYCVTDRAGLFRSRDGGTTWEDANLGEATFRQASSVDLLLAPGPTVYALALLHDEPGDEPNPLFRLQRRDWLLRWRIGLAERLLGNARG